jgi:hypothetical protein
MTFEPRTPEHRTAHFRFKQYCSAYLYNVEEVRNGLRQRTSSLTRQRGGVKNKAFFEVSYEGDRAADSG